MLPYALRRYCIVLYCIVLFMTLAHFHPSVVQPSAQCLTPCFKCTTTPFAIAVHVTLLRDVVAKVCFQSSACRYVQYEFMINLHFYLK
jgi:hypothetical protein